MSPINRLGRHLEQAIARFFTEDPPPADGLPWYVAPLPQWVEDAGLRLAYPIAFANLLGTLFGFWYYGFRPIPLESPLVQGQFARTPEVMWLFVPDSPMATLFIGLSLIAWKRNWQADWLHVLAFFGCIKLGLWTPYVQVLLNGPGGVAAWMWHFLIWSHVAMAVEAFLIHRYARFGVGSIALATGWFLANDVVDYFVPILGEPHHSTVLAEYANGVIEHSSHVHDLAAAWAVVLTVLAVFLALTTRVEKLKLGR